MSNTSHLTGPMEVEWQFEASDLGPVEHWLSDHAAYPGLSIANGTVIDLTDTYLDTEGWRLHRAGYVLRVRRKGDGAEATLKSTEPARNGLRNRLEITEPLENADAQTVANAPGEVGRYFRAIAGRRSPQPLFDVRNNRRIWRLQLDGAEVAEVLLDRVSVPTGDGEPRTYQRVEAEARVPVHPALEALVEEMRAACRLQPATTSKYELGLEARGLSPEDAPDLGPTDVDASQQTGEVALAVLRKHFQAFLDNELGTRLGDDPEAVHDMRVAARRLRAAISLFGDALPGESQRIREELRWVASALGEVRDLDVQLEQVNTWVRESPPEDRDALGSLVDLLQGRRESARRRMLRALDSQRYDRLVSDFTAFLRAGESPEDPMAGAPVLATAPRLISRRYRKVRRLGDTIGEASPPEEYHELRISAKRLRYALEFLSPVYGKRARALIEPLVELQDLLGAHQDAQVAVENLRTLGYGGDRKLLPPRTVFVMGGIAERYTRRGAELRAQFPDTYKQLQGKRWRKLEEVMKERRPPVFRREEQPEEEPGEQAAEPPQQQAGAHSEPDPQAEYTQ